MVRKKIENLIKGLQIYKEISKRYKDGLSLEVVEPNNPEHGDYTAEISYIGEAKRMKGGRKMRTGGNLLKGEYDKIITALNKEPEFKKYFDKPAEFKFPIFINFFLAEKYLQEQVKEVLKQKENFGRLKDGKGKKVQVEFISANPTGPLTLGNGRGGFCGDALAKVLEKAGYEVEREYYINDTGGQVKKLGLSLTESDESVRPYKGEYIEALRKRIKEKNPDKAGEKAAAVILKEMIKPTVERMGIKFDVWFSEKSLYESGQVDETLSFLKEKKLTYEKEGAIWFRSSRFGDEKDRVLVKKDGETTYLASDAAYLKNKFNRGFDLIIYLWGADHYGYINRIKAAVEALGFKKDQIQIILMQLVQLFQEGKEVRMSKRKGVYITLDELIDEVGLDVARFFFLSKSPGRHLNFDLDAAKDKSEKNPVHYVQYAYARICSILKKLKIKSEDLKITINDLELLRHKSELALIKQLMAFPEIIADTSRDYQLQRLPRYASGLAASFHSFYRDCPVLQEEGKLKRTRTALLLAVKSVLENTLNLMGISAPEKM